MRSLVDTGRTTENTGVSIGYWFYENADAGPVGGIKYSNGCPVEFTKDCSTLL